MATIEEQIKARFPPKKPQELPVRMVLKRRPPPLVPPGATVLLPAQKLAAILPVACLRMAINVSLQPKAFSLDQYDNHLRKRDGC